MQPEIGNRSLRPIKLTDAAASIRVIAICDGWVLKERTGEVSPISELPEIIENSEESIIVADGFDHHFNSLNDHFKDHPRWQYRAVIQELTNGDPRISTTVSYFGFKRPNNRQRRRAKYFYPVALDTFIPDLYDIPGENDLVKMLTFGIGLRDFCADMGIRPRTAGTGIAGQLLKHPAFYPDDRRRVPAFIDDIARPHLPANHYGLMCTPNETIEAATYIDQKSAHHHAAKTTPLPSSNNLIARGFSKIPSKDCSAIHRWLSPGSEAFANVLANHHGLIRANVTVPTIHKQHHDFILPALKRENGNGYRGELWFWSNERAALEEWGMKINYLIAAYTATEVDEGLPRYADWAQRQEPWLKTTLLSAYGILATVPRRTRFIHANSSRGEAVQFPLGPHLIDGVATPIKVTHNGVCNVVQRGLIESHVRLLSLGLARNIRDTEGEVLSIYGDGIFVRAGKGKQLPLPVPWRNKADIHNLTYENATRLRSDEITRLPGTPKFFREYAYAGNREP